MNKQKTLSRNMYMYILLMPAVIVMTVFCYLPYGGLLIAFKDYDVITGFVNSEWVGLKNFITVLSTPKFLETTWRTLKYSSVLIFGTFPFPILLALMINELRCKTFKRISQTLTYLPHFLSWITVVGLFFSFLSINGPINDALSKILGASYEKKNILLESKYFLGIIFSAQLWKELGWSSILYLAAIAGIDQSLYEAASVDGCGKLKQVFYITLPAILPTAVILLIMKLGSIFNTSFELIYGFQNSYTQAETDVISTLIYRQGIQGGEYSLATAFGMMQGLVSVFLVFFSNTLAKKAANISIW